MSFISILDGLMLGDGCLQVPPQCKNARYTHGSKHYGYMAYLSNIAKLGRFDVNGPVYVPHTLKSNGKTYDSYHITVNTDPFLTSQQKRWYITKEKHIPSDIAITPELMLHWYIGDGSLNWYGKNNKKINSIRLGTYDFLCEELQYITEKIYVETSIVLQRRKSGFLETNVKDVYKFLDYIGLCPVICYYYKWQTKDYEKYSNMRNSCFCLHEDNQQPSLYL